MERLIGANDLVGIAYLERGFRAPKSICRIHLRDAHSNTVGRGTGFLVAPGVLMTNHHVIADEGLRSVHLAFLSRGRGSKPLVIPTAFNGEYVAEE